jgi:hypothetical protein
VFLDAMVAAGPAVGAVGAGVNYAQYRLTRHDRALLRAQLEAEAAELRLELDFERRARILHQYGLAGLDVYDTYGVVDPVTGFGVEDEPIDFTCTEWFDSE